MLLYSLRNTHDTIMIQIYDTMHMYHVCQQDLNNNQKYCMIELINKIIHNALRKAASPKIYIAVIGEVAKNKLHKALWVWLFDNPPTLNKFMWHDVWYYELDLYVDLLDKTNRYTDTIFIYHDRIVRINSRDIYDAFKQKDPPMYY